MVKKWAVVIVALLALISLSYAYYVQKDNSNPTALSQPVETEEAKVAVVAPPAAPGLLNSDDFREPKKSSVKLTIKNVQNPPREFSSDGSSPLSLPPRATVAPTPVVIANTIQPSSPPEILSEQNVKSEQVISPPREKFWMWLGGGLGILTSSQTAPNITSLDFDKILAPTLSVRAGFLFSPRMGLDFFYRGASGSLKSSDTLQASSSNFQWSEASGEFLWRDPFGASSKENHWGLRLGFRQFQMPLLIPDGANNINIVETNLTNASVGIDYSVPVSTLRIEGQLRYQHPLRSSAETGTLTYSAKQSFDASFGAVQTVSKNLKAGIYFNSAWQSHDFTYRSPGATVDYQGSVSRFYNGVDLRIGMEF